MNNIISQEEKDRIDNLCKQFEITNYTINTDGSIDVDGNVSFCRYALKKIPFTFNKVSGWFHADRIGLTTLVGCPREVGSVFICAYNHLTSLEGSPTKIGDNFYFNDNAITTFEHYPKEVGGGTDYDNNSLPWEFHDLIKGLTYREESLFLKYQNYYDVWTPQFSVENMHLLIGDIKDGLE